jgi:hypothetical protein
VVAASAGFIASATTEVCVGVTVIAAAEAASSAYAGATNPYSTPNNEKSTKSFFMVLSL